MKLTRRQFIAVSAGGAGAVLSCMGGGAAVFLLAQKQEPSVPIIATSSVNRQNSTKFIDKPAIIPRADWGALPPDHDAENESGVFSEDNPEGWEVYSGDIRDVYKTLVIHHSVIDEGDDIASLLEVQRLHRDERGWADVAYHFFVGQEGAVYEGRAIDVRGTHVAAYNTGSLGVCLLGNFMESTVSEAQFSALRLLSRWLTVRLQLTHLAGHHDFNPETVCPGDNLAPKLPELATHAGLLFGTEGYDGPNRSATSGDTSFRCTCHSWL